jgi:hypothetical protein
MCRNFLRHHYVLAQCSEGLSRKRSDTFLLLLTHGISTPTRGYMLGKDGTVHATKFIYSPYVNRPVTSRSAGKAPTSTKPFHDMRNTTVFGHELWFAMGSCHQFWH